MTGYMYKMKIYLGKDKQNEAEMMIATQVTVRSLTRRVDGVGYKLYMDNLFMSPDLSDDLHTRGINCCGTIRQNCEGMLGGL